MTDYSTVWKLGEHVPEDKGGFEADCIICGDRWPCDSYRRLMDYAEAGSRLATIQRHGEIIYSLSAYAAPLDELYVGDVLRVLSLHRDLTETAVTLQKIEDVSA